MKKLALVLAAALMLTMLCACGSGNPNYVTFKNKTGETIDNIYISSANQDEWGDALTSSTISNGSSVKVAASKFFVEGESVYDFGAIDSNALNYDVYEIDLAIGDTIVLTDDTLTVVSADGSTAEYEVYTYEE